MTDYDLQAWARRMNSLHPLQGMFDQYLIGTETFEQCTRNAIELLLPIRAKDLDRCRQEYERLANQSDHLSDEVSSLMEQVENLKNELKKLKNI